MYENHQERIADCIAEQAKRQGWIDEAAALAILTGRGDYAESQALIILGHSLQRSINGCTHYPRAYIEQRATAHANAPEPILDDYGKRIDVWNFPPGCIPDID